MNSDFIQELKEKRERYGVLQSRLAVACGISREYYNRIENGKTELTEVLKGEIQKYRRFSGWCYDYIKRYVCPGTDGG